jgi:hypothetical protein
VINHRFADPAMPANGPESNTMPRDNATHATSAETALPASTQPAPGGRGRVAEPPAFDAEAERKRLAEARDQRAVWYRWGSYLSDRQWGTVREDYSPGGTAWDAFPHDHARSRAYRWGEDGLLGISDDQGLLCFALALWNGADPILKERLYGLTGSEGNHGEDVKESYFYLDATPTHSYMKALYKYPQRAFPYTELREENQRRGRGAPEYELVDTGIFSENRYTDVLVEYAKAGPEDILARITLTNRGPDPARLDVLPTLWFRNTWAWGEDPRQPELHAVPAADRDSVRLIQASSPHLGEYWLACAGAPSLLFTENETNAERLWGVPNRAPYVKDAFHEAIIAGAAGTTNPALTGTKAAAHYALTLAPSASETVLLRLSATRTATPFADAAEVFARRRAEADAFYHRFGPAEMSADARSVQRQAFAGLLWSKQFYLYEVSRWLGGDPAGPPPPPEHTRGRNSDWRHLGAADVLSMPDAWEYPWFAAWDLAFHCVPLAQIDPEFAKRQLSLLVREWYMHPNGQLPAYEWAFGDVNPPVHAWAAWRVYKIEKRLTGQADRAFLERIFHKLLLNFTWWVNRKDHDGHNVFQGGFLGLDNIGVFDRSAQLPTGGHLEQSDGTAWMGMYSLNMLAIALELARENPVYEDVATKFFEHFLSIAEAMNNVGGEGVALWNEADGFFYDVLHLPSDEMVPLRLRTLVGLMPLLAVETIEPDLLERLPGFRERLEWYLTHRPDLASLVSRWQEPGQGERRLLALVRGHRMKHLLRRMLDREEFLSDHGIRSISRAHAAQPYVLAVNGGHYEVRYEPAESGTGFFGGNSNWRGPVWFPINFLLIEALQKFHHYYGDDFLIEFPTGTGQCLTLWQVAEQLSCRLTHLFLRDADGRRPVFGANEQAQTDPHWRDYVLFHEYFHGDTGAGLGASHQTGWTALVAKLLEQTRGHTPLPCAPTPELERRS